MTENNNFSLTKLFAEMKFNAQNLDSKKSYTSYLASLESEDITKKFMEEAYELSLAAVEKERHKGSKENVIAEASDVIYHLLAVLLNRNVEFSEVMTELEKRNKKLK